MNDSSVQKALSLGQSNHHLILKDYGGGKDRVWVYNIPVKVDKKVIGNIYIESKINDVYNQLNNINQIFIVGTAISLLITVILGFFIARRLPNQSPICVTRRLKCPEVTIRNVARFMVMMKLAN